MKKIVCLSTSPWHPIPTRKQQVMSRIPDAEILYFDPSVTYLAPLKDKNARPKLKAFRQPAEDITPRLHVYALPPVLPFFNKYRLINRLNQRRVARFVSKTMKARGFEEPVLWCYSPVSADAVGHIPHSALVYDCVDRHSAYGGLMDPALVDAMELELAGQADMVFATAQSLADRLHTVNKRTCFIPNGANYERFSQAALPQPLPEDLKEIPGPILGFVGALQECIAYDYPLSAAKAHPEWSFVFIGRENPGVDLSALRALPNCHFLGMKPNEQLPQYLAHFDVCLNLFDAGPLSKDVSPLKFYEYLATGRPIVSTKAPDQVLQYGNVIEIADSPDSFIRCCARAISDTSSERRDARMEQGRLSSWDARVAEMCRVLQENGIF